MAVALSVAEREEIALGLSVGESFRSIASRLGRAPSTVSREIARNGGRQGGPYRAHRGQARADKKRRRWRARRLMVNAELRELVLAKMRARWAPQQISAWLTQTYPDRPEMRLSHETIYRAVYVHGATNLQLLLREQIRLAEQGRVEGEITAGSALRSGRGRGARRKVGQRKLANRTWIDLRIADRPAEVDDRVLPGHWEGDLLCGARNQSQIGTLVERVSRFVLLVPLVGGRVSEYVVTELATAMLTLPEALRRTLTWDQGLEMAEHATFSLSTGCEVYFCDPRSPWQRPTNENTNGLLRDYWPKGTDFRQVPVADLAELPNQP